MEVFNNKRRNFISFYDLREQRQKIDEIIEEEAYNQIHWEVINNCKKLGNFFFRLSKFNHKR
jgi:monomeric isocitrate dehydrogenase